MITKKIALTSLLMVFFSGCDADKEVQNVVDDAKGLINDQQTVTDASDVNLSVSIQELLDSHNNARHDVGVNSEMKWSETIAADAKLYADEMATKGIWEHDSQRNQNDGYGHGNYGENLYVSSSASVTFLDASNSWIDEKADYTYGKIGDENSCVSGKMCGHYTQIIWKNTTLVGCAKSQYKVDVFIGGHNFKGSHVVVCKYQLPGNFVGETPY